MHGVTKSLFVLLHLLIYFYNVELGNSNILFSKRYIFYNKRYSQHVKYVDI